MALRMSRVKRAVVGKRLVCHWGGRIETLGVVVDITFDGKLYILHFDVGDTCTISDMLLDALARTGKTVSFYKDDNESIKSNMLMLEEVIE